MMGTPASLSELHGMVHRGPKNQDWAGMLGPGLLVGNLPEESQTDSWTFRTAFHAPLPPAVDGSGLNAATQVWPLRKQGQLKSFQNVILVGRAASNDIVLGHSQVSKLHARIRITDQAAFIMDAKSSNGTFVNGQKLGDVETPLKDGDIVGFGSVVLGYFSRASLLRILSALAKI